ncbi:permease-like cell division protein FtsX [Microbispora sp. H11081]|uniref:permease-like cell division protein FtsX n=1 Tax=Microbispora sp. H11081 TaxID=2729107 RepID=UPI00147542B4|nr:permease-like cell division protein FtsX [Microbispora sp. H11081]
MLTREGSSSLPTTVLAVVTAVLLVASCGISGCGISGPSVRPVASPSGSATPWPPPDDPWPRTSALTPSPPPDGPWPETGQLSVFFCARSSGFDACDERGAATSREIRRVRALLAAAPEVRKVQFVSQAEKLRRERKMFRDEPDILETLELEDMAASYEVRVGSGDWPALVRRLSKAAGVSDAFVIRDDYWPGRADVMIQLCVRTDSAGGPCVGRGFATLAEKNAVLDRIDDLPGLDKVYFQARSQQGSVWHRRNVPDSAPVPGLPEMFYLKFTSPPVLSEVRRALRGAAGVAFVGPVDASTAGKRV